MNVEIHIHNIKSQIVVRDEAGKSGPFPGGFDTKGKPIPHPVVGALDKELCYYVDMMIGFQMRSVPVKRFSTKTYKFDTGCVSYVGKILRTFDIEFTVVDKRIPTPPGKEIPVREGVAFRPYQQEAIEAAFKAQRGVLKLATGAGKTMIAGGLIAKLNLKTVVFVHTIDLLEQFKESLEFTLNMEIGQIGGGIVDPKHITVCMMQTVVRSFSEKYVQYEFDPSVDDDTEDSLAYTQNQQALIRNTVESAQVVISDECHHLSCTTLQTLFKKANNAFYRYGLTATLREDGADLVIYGVTGKIVYEVSASFLIEHNPPYLVRPTIYYLKVPRPKQGQGKYQQRYASDIVENKDRNALVVQSTMRLVKKGYRVLILAQQIKHLKIIREMIEDGYDESIWPDLKDYDSRTIQHELATGQVNKVDRKRIIESMRKGQLECMLASTIADEGLDCPPISAVILAGGGKSATKAFQRVGRALRLYPGKTQAVIIDFFDQGKYFKKHAEKRMELFQREPAFILKIEP